jgi:hypothetical protein
MAKKIDTGFRLDFPENLKKDSNLPTTSRFSYNDFGNFVEEREKIKRAVERNLETELRIDYSTFGNHVFFDSAEIKFGVAKDRVLNKYPFNGTDKEKEYFELTSSGYENYVFDAWPKYVGYAEFNGTDQFITASDYNRTLVPGTSSVLVSAWAKPTFTAVGKSHPMAVYISGSGDLTEDNFGWSLEFMYPSAALDPEVQFHLYSGSANHITVSASIAGISGTFKSYAGVYDAVGDIVYILINDVVKQSASADLGAFEFNTSHLIQVASSSIQDATTYSGSLNEIRVVHTSSVPWYQKNYSRPISAFSVEGTGSDDFPEDYLKLYYKFNEGVVGTGSVDQVVVDYSRHGNHGTFLGYTVDSCRTSGTMMLEDPGDPILYDCDSRVASFTASVENSASLYDNNNANFIYNMIPGGLLLEEEKTESLMQSFALSLARFFDEVKLYFDQFDNLRVTNYSAVDETPDLFLSNLQRYFGWKVSEHFGDVDSLSFLFGEGVLASGSMDVSLMEIRNQFWRRTLNNLPYLLKTKGKRHNLDAYFNVLGINRENLSIKEYGYLPGSSIQDTRIRKERVVPIIGIGTGSLGTLSSSFVKVTGAIGPSSGFTSLASTSYTVEALAQFPFASSSYSGSILTGSIWQFVDPEQVTGSFSLMWILSSSIGDSKGRFLLTSSDGQSYETEDVDVFDGDFVYIAAGLDASSLPFVEIRTIDNDEIDFSASYLGATALSGVFTGSKYDFIMGANSGTVYHQEETQGFYTEYRLWNRILSSSELDDHALHFQSVGIRDPLEIDSPLVGHWALDQNITASAAEEILEISDLSRNGLVANAYQFPAGENVYQKFLLEYNYLSPSIDLKWSENKIRIRDKTELTIDDVATDTNEVSLEFSLVDALNEDISKIFSTFDVLNDVIGAPVNKYRDEYSNLENMRNSYFARLGDSVNFISFFNMFKWFDRKLSDSIKQLLPARVHFIGGEQVVESHFLERPRYPYNHPIFRTPQSVPELGLTASAGITGSLMKTLPEAGPASILTTHGRTYIEENTEISGIIAPRDSVVTPAVDVSKKFKMRFADGEEQVDRNPENFYRTKYSGDTDEDEVVADVGVNSKNSYARFLLNEQEQNNISFKTNSIYSGTFINSKLGNGFVMNSINSTLDQEHYFGGCKKHLQLTMKGLSGSIIAGGDVVGVTSSLDGVITINRESDSGVAQVYISGILYDRNSVLIDSASFLKEVFNDIDQDREKHEMSISFEFSASVAVAATDLLQFGIFYDLENTLTTGGSFGGNDAAYLVTALTGTDAGWSLYRAEVGVKDAGRLTNPVPGFRTSLLRKDGSEQKGVCFLIQSNGTTEKQFRFRNIKFEFSEDLTDAGVERVKNIDNQHTDKIMTYVNRNVMPKVED